MGLWSKFLSYFKEHKLMISIKESWEQALSYSTSVSYAKRGRMYYSHAGPRSLRSKLARNIFVLPTFNTEVSSRPSESLLSDRLVSSASFQWNTSLTQ
jgi:hypothetical protein